MKREYSEAEMLRVIGKRLSGKNSFLGLLSWIDKMRNAYIESVKRRTDIPEEGKAQMIRDANRARGQLRWQALLVHLSLALYHGSEDFNGRTK
jgi:hypothetical protein